MLVSASLGSRNAGTAGKSSPYPGDAAAGKVFLTHAGNVPSPSEQ